MLLSPITESLISHGNLAKDKECIKVRLNSSVGRNARCLYVHKLNILLPTCTQGGKKNTHLHTTKQEKQSADELRDSAILIGRTTISNQIKKEVLQLNICSIVFLLISVDGS